MISHMIRWLLRLVILTCLVCLAQGSRVAHALKDLVFIDASFASQVIDRQPIRVSKSPRVGSLTDSRLWFWVHLSCTGECAQKLAAKGHLTLFVDWYMKEKGIMTKQASLPLNVKGTTWRTWQTKRVKPGVWTVVVRAEDLQWVCLKEKCDFTIEVKP
jgi:hypothetical protein